MGAEQSVPTVDGPCRPTYIIFQKGAAEGYTPYTFNTLQELGKWVIDRSVLSTSTPTPLVAPPIQVEEPPEEPEYESLAQIFLATAFLHPTQTTGLAPMTFLKSQEVQLLTEFVVKHPEVYSSRLFKQDTMIPALTDKAILSHERFRHACNENRAILEKRLECYSAADTTSLQAVFSDLYKLLFAGEHLRSWDKVWAKGVVFEGVGEWSTATAAAILEELLLAWCRDDKPSDAIRKFILKVYIVRNYRVQWADNPLAQRSQSREVSSSEFLSAFLQDAGGSLLAMPLPATFASWAIKGVTYSLCKAAFADLGIEQVRKSHGQVFANVIRSFVFTEDEGRTAPNHLARCFAVHPLDDVVYFSGKDEIYESYQSTQLGTTAEFYTPPVPTGPTEPSRISVSNLEPGKSFIDLYREERDKVCALPVAPTEAEIRSGNWFNCMFEKAKETATKPEDMTFDVLNKKLETERQSRSTPLKALNTDADARWTLPTETPMLLVT